MASISATSSGFLRELDDQPVERADIDRFAIPLIALAIGFLGLLGLAMPASYPRLPPGSKIRFAGRGYSARQGSALLQMTWDHVSSALDGQESAFELHANGGMPAWRGRLRRSFASYNELANSVLNQANVAMPPIDLDSVRAMPIAPPRPVTPSR